VLELNCQAATMAFRSSSLLHRLAEVPVETAMRYVAEHYGDVWQVGRGRRGAGHRSKLAGTGEEWSAEVFSQRGA
jgi:hypothetical protein